MRLFFFTLFTCCCLAGSGAQTTPGKWWVEFTDKDRSPFCTCRPAEFLSARALDRRAKNGIALVQNDLPVNPDYLSGLRTAGAQIHNTSRWLNAASVVADSAAVHRIRALPYVRSVQYVGRHIRVTNPPGRPAKNRAVTRDYPIVSENPFGYAALQNSLLGVPLLYAAGARGRDVWIAVMDGGFTNADTIPLFDSVALQGRLYQGRDFVERDGAVFESASHGTGVLSVMAADLPGYFVGTAPEATYFLLKTEDTGGEYPVEECNWVAGAEWADSLGADIINASLGYTVFNDTTLGHRPWELDGRTSIGARGAAIAATKGMIICNSAGNAGDEPWKLIGVPADAVGVLAVGSVAFDGKRSGFSSTGPSADGRIKPDFAAPGDRLATAGYSGLDLGMASGTSVAAPMLSGSIASLWSAYPEKTAREILNAVFASADQFDNPDNERGYGMPDMTRAYLRLGGYMPYGLNYAGPGTVWAYNRNKGVLSLLFIEARPLEPFYVAVKNVAEASIAHGQVSYADKGILRLEIHGLENAAPGTYRIRITDREQTFNLKIFLP